MFDYAAFIARCRGMIAAPNATIREHVQPVPPWATVAREHLLPLIVLAATVSTLLVVIIYPEIAAFEDLLRRFIRMVVIGIAGAVVMAGVIMFFAGIFGGRATFSAAFVTVALALTPYFLTEALLPLPLIGILASFAGLIYSLMLLYRAGPIALQLPWQNRGKHFALSILSLLLIAMLAAPVLLPIFAPEMGSMGSPVGL